MNTKLINRVVTFFSAAMLVSMLFSYDLVAAKTKAVERDDDASASSFESKSYDVGLLVGAWLPGTIDIEGVSADKDMSLLFRVFADAYLIPKFAVGCYFNYSSASIESEGYEAIDGSFTEFGITLKPRFFISPQMAVKPGLNIGYRKTSVEGLDDIDGMGLNLSVELQYMMSNNYIVFFEGGFLSQPTGGNDVVSVTWAPIIYVAAGICF